MKLVMTMLGRDAADILDSIFLLHLKVCVFFVRATINDPRSLYRPNLKIIHRSDPNVTVSIGAQRLIDSRSVPLRGWYPVEFFHFPVRSLEQCERKYAHQQTGPGQTPSPYYDR